MFMLLEMATVRVFSRRFVYVLTYFTVAASDKKWISSNGNTGRTVCRKSFFFLRLIAYHNASDVAEAKLRERSFRVAVNLAS